MTCLLFGYASEKAVQSNTAARALSGEGEDGGIMVTKRYNSCGSVG